jgi:hypothetical protein
MTVKEWYNSTNPKGSALGLITQHMAAGMPWRMTCADELSHHAHLLAQQTRPHYG